MPNKQKQMESHLKRKAQKRNKEHVNGNSPNRAGYIMSIFILVTMVGSTFGFIMYYNDSTNKQNTFEYNGFKLKNDNNMWTLDLSGKNLEFYNHPTQLENIAMPAEIRNELLNGNIIVVTFDPDNLSQVYAQYIDQVRLDLSTSINAISAVTKKSDSYSQLTPITCANKTVTTKDGSGKATTQNLDIIYLKRSNQTRMSVENGCVILESQDALGFLELKDRLVYGLFGIMK